MLEPADSWDDWLPGCCSMRAKPEKPVSLKEPEPEAQGCFTWVYKCAPASCAPGYVHPPLLEHKPLRISAPARPLPPPPEPKRWVTGVIKTPLGTKPTYFVVEEDFILMTATKPPETLAESLARKNYTALYRTEDNPLVYETSGQKPFVYPIFGFKFTFTELRHTLVTPGRISVGDQTQQFLCDNGGVFFLPNGAWGPKTEVVEVVPFGKGARPE